MQERFTQPPEAGVEYALDRFSLPIAMIDSAFQARIETRRREEGAGHYYVMHQGGSGGRDVVACESRYPERRKLYLHRIVADLIGLEGQQVTFANGDSFDCRAANIVAHRGGCRPGGRMGPRPGRRPFTPEGITRRPVGNDTFAIGPGPRVRRDDARRHDQDEILGYVRRTAPFTYEWSLFDRADIVHPGYANFHDASFALADAAGWRT